jgi:uncharacterized protein (TIGR02118 family)
MVKLIFLCRRRPDLTPARYAELVLHGHVPLALRHHPTMRGYTVNIVENAPAPLEPVDSIGQLWFDSLDDYRDRLYDSEEGRQIIERDVAGFMGGADAYVTTEHVQKDEAMRVAPGEPSPGVKLVCPLWRRPDLTHEQFVEHWLGCHVPLAKEHHPAMDRYVTNVVAQRLGTNAPALDGIAEIHFPSAEVLARGFFASVEGERIVREDIARFIGRTGPYRVVEYVQKRPG